MDEFNTSLYIYSHEDCWHHEMGAYHPESPARLTAIQQALLQSPFVDKLNWHSAPQATRAQLRRVHAANYIDSIFSIVPQQGYVQLDPDTTMNPYTLKAALRAAGAVVAAVDAIYSGETNLAFCLVRPPGHHAEADKAMGFCFFNNIAIGVAHALAIYRAKKIVIVDFDVHHGNGTEQMFFNEPRVHLWSSFQHPFYPGATLDHKPPNIHLCPLPAGTGSEAFRTKVDKEVVPLLKKVQPEIIFISAGFDAHQRDPLANLRLTNEDYAYITTAICQVMDSVGKRRIVSTLEGGYDLTALAEAVPAHLHALLTS